MLLSEQGKKRQYEVVVARHCSKVVTVFASHHSNESVALSQWRNTAVQFSHQPQ